MIYRENGQFKTTYRADQQILPILQDRIAMLLLLVVGVTVAHLWLPAGKRRLRDVAPGVVITLMAWLIGAILFAYYIQTFANYARTYAGLASLMIALVFLYITAVIFILGAEFNAAMLKYRVFQRLLPSASRRRREADEAADI